MVPNIGLFDICLGFFYLFIIYYLFYLFNRKNTNFEQKWFYYALSAKVVGAILFVAISVFYYEGGDTFLYFKIAEDVRHHLFTNFSGTIKLLFTPYHQLSDLPFNPLEQFNYYYERNTTWAFSRVTFLFDLISFGSYWVSSLLFSVISFIGLWLGYTSFCRLYPKASKYMLIPFFLVPTSLIWSSGILKDTLIQGAIGVLIFSFSNLFIFRKKWFPGILLLVIALFLILFIKPFLLYVLIPCFFIWILPYMVQPVKNLMLKWGISFLTIIVIVGAGYFINSVYLEKSSKYKLENMVHTIKGFQLDHTMNAVVKDQSVYTLGDISFTFWGIIKKLPEAINVTFFRPYLWEVNNLPMLLEAIQSLILLIIFFYSVIVLNKQFLKRIINNHEVRFMMLFAVVFSVLTGITSYNFGALSRFKIPAVMFFLLSIIICYATSGKNYKTNFIAKYISKIFNI